MGPLDVLGFQLDQLERWFLMLFRIAGMLTVFPIYGFTGIPVMIRAGFAVLLTSLLFPLQPAVELALAPGIISFFGVVLLEAIVGLAIGMMGNFLFYGVMFAGHVIGQTAGFAIISVIDPMQQEQVPIIAQLLNFFTLVLFLMIGGHHFLLLAIDESFLRIPLGGAEFASSMAEGFARMTADIFVVGVKLGAPVLVSVLTVEFGLGILSRSVPQINVWLVGFPLKIATALGVLAFTLPFFVFVWGKMYKDWQGTLIDFIRAFMPS